MNWCDYLCVIWCTTAFVICLCYCIMESQHALMIICDSHSTWPHSARNGTSSSFLPQSEKGCNNTTLNLKPNHSRLMTMWPKTRQTNQSKETSNNQHEWWDGQLFSCDSNILSAQTPWYGSHTQVSQFELTNPFEWKVKLILETQEKVSPCVQDTEILHRKCILLFWSEILYYTPQDWE